MRILAIDIGTGTQDILLFDTAQPIENAPKLVMPSPTAIAAQHIRAATQRRRPIALHGVTAGGGPSHWALTDHLHAGLPAYATPDAARTFDDDLDRLQADGITLIADDELAGLDADPIILRDLDLDAIWTALRAFGIDPAIDGLAIGVLDHGAAPPDTSDRLFRFAHLKRILATSPDPRAFAFTADNLPDYLTRARAVFQSTTLDVPTIVMDNGAAAVLGALHDPAVADRPHRLVLNVGNMHALGYALTDTHIDAVLEHHTGELTSERLAQMTIAMQHGTLTQHTVFTSNGHGVHYVATPPFLADITIVTGPRRRAIMPHLANAHAAAPHGDMMLTGSFGLLDGFAFRFPPAQEFIDTLHDRQSAAH
jgi:uncharacterized protein (DUF1786 family)